MPSPQSYIFRLITKMISNRIDTISSIPRLRAFMAASSAKLQLPRGAVVQPARADDVSVEWIVPSSISSQSVILYLHGGGWTMGWYNSHRSLAAYICQAASIRALAVDYRLAPEAPYPAALEDCLTAYRWLLKNGISPQQIVIAGDSAGGNLTLTTLMSLRDTGVPLPAAAVCISPMTDLACTGKSFHKNNDALLTVKFASNAAHYYAGDKDPRLPLISPHYGSLKGLPPLLIQVGADEILLDDATRLADNALAAGVDARLAIWPYMWHVWHTFVPYLPEAQQAVDATGAFIKEQIEKAGPI